MNEPNRASMRRNTRDSLDNVHEQALTQKKKEMLQTFPFSLGQSCRNTFQTNKAVIYT